MTRQFVYRDLVDEATGRVNLVAYRAMCRARSIREYGSVCVAGLKSAGRWYRQHIADMQSDWESRHGIPQAMHEIYPFGEVRDGVRRSAF